MTDEVVEKLAQLLEQDQFELIFQEAKVRLVYLMNDAVESFLVFKNVRITGRTGSFSGKTGAEICPYCTSGRDSIYDVF